MNLQAATGVFYVIEIIGRLLNFVRMWFVYRFRVNDNQCIPE